MSREAFLLYRELEAELVCERWQTSGRSTPRIEQLLKEMEQVWWDLDESEQRKLDEEPARSLLPRDLHRAAPTPITTQAPTPRGLMTAAQLHQQEAAKLLSLTPPEVSQQQLLHLLSFGPACARGAQISVGGMARMLGTQLTQGLLDLAVALDPIASQHASQLQPAPSNAAAVGSAEQVLANAQEEVDKVALELLSAGVLGGEAP